MTGCFQIACGTWWRLPRRILRSALSAPTNAKMTRSAWTGSLIPAPRSPAGRLYFLKGTYVFGTPTSLLLRPELIRSREPFYDERYAPFEDGHAFFDLLKTRDFSFVHQVLTYSRRDNESTISRVHSFGLEPFLHLSMLVAQGREYLSWEEYDRCLKHAERQYFLYLSKCVCALRHQSAEFGSTMAMGWWPSITLLTGVFLEMVGQGPLLQSGRWTLRAQVEAEQEVDGRLRETGGSHSVGETWTGAGQTFTIGSSGMPCRSGCTKGVDTVGEARGLRTQGKGSLQGAPRSARRPGGCCAW